MNCGAAKGRTFPCSWTMSGSESDCAMTTTPSTASASETSYEPSWAHVRMEPRSEYFDSDDQPPTMKPYTPIEPSAKITSSPIDTFSTSPFTCQPLMSQPA